MTDLILAVMANANGNHATRTHIRKVTMDELSPATHVAAPEDPLTLTAEDWRIGAEQLIGIEPTPVSEVMKQDPIPLFVQAPPSPPPSTGLSVPCPLPLTLPEDLLANTSVPSSTAMTLPMPGLPLSTPSVESPVVSSPKPITVPSLTVSHSRARVSAPRINKRAGSFKPTKTKRARRSKEPLVLHYIDEVTDLDCVLGRGGKSNHHPGNKRYRAEVQNLQKWYKSSGKAEKTDLAQHLVNYVHSYGGRFVKQEKSTGRWYVVSNLVARRKASQALREHMTMEERVAKKAALAIAKPATN